MVHAYLMYGFPTQTLQETVDALEVVRQLFLNEALQSGFWHRFAMTAHSPVGLNPAQFKVERVGPDFGGFADNDLYHEDPTGADHDMFSEGLSKSLFNFMHGVGLDFALSKWFDFKTPKTTVAPNYIERHLNDGKDELPKENALVIWLGNMPEVAFFEAKQGNKIVDMAELEFCDKKKDWHLHVTAQEGNWLMEVFPTLIIGENEPMPYAAFKKSYEAAGLGDFEGFVKSRKFNELMENGMLVL